MTASFCKVWSSFTLWIIIIIIHDIVQFDNPTVCRRLPKLAGRLIMLSSDIPGIEVVENFIVTKILTIVFPSAVHN